MCGGVFRVGGVQTSKWCVITPPTFLEKRVAVFFFPSRVQESSSSLMARRASRFFGGGLAGVVHVGLGAAGRGDEGVLVRHPALHGAGGPGEGGAVEGGGLAAEPGGL